jgi:phosphopantetheinyl transferase
VACVLAPEKGGRIGLDLEPRGSVTARQLRLVTSTAERLVFGDDASDATALWVAKEAALKCVGMGIERIAEVAVDAGLARHGAEQYALLPVAALVGYTVCIAQSGAAPAVEVSLIEHEALPLLAALPCAEAAQRFHAGRA